MLSQISLTGSTCSVHTSEVVEEEEEQLVLGNDWSTRRSCLGRPTMSHCSEKTVMQSTPQTFAVATCVACPISLPDAGATIVVSRATRRRLAQHRCGQHTRKECRYDVSSHGG